MSFSPLDAIYVEWYISCPFVNGEFVMKATIENGQLVIRIPVEATPRPSSSGKTLIVATSSGNVTTDCIVEGKPLVIGLNAYIKR